MKHKDLYDILEVEYDNGKPVYIKRQPQIIRHISHHLQENDEY